MRFTAITHVYFLGIGGIGMSAIARYFNSKNCTVSGYDKTESPLTKSLVSEGITLHYNDLGEDVLQFVHSPENTLVIYTPAVPTSLEEYKVLKSNGFAIKKRAEVLGIIASDYKCLAVAGTHGKTTSSTLLAHVLKNANIPCDAFLGGISTNYNTNLLLEKGAPWMVVEADEFDRSFLQLHPFISVITSYDADHLDIYQTSDALKESFQDYANQINPSGKLIKHHQLDLTSKCQQITYGISEDFSTIDYCGFNLRYENGKFLFDLKTPQQTWEALELGIFGIHNVENALAIIALCTNIGLSENTIRDGLKTFQGVKRRFEYHIRGNDLVFIDDYAHHPTAIAQLIASIRLIYPALPITGIFQPHLFSRTADFMDEFANELSKLDNCILLPIYPAREEPIEGITSDVLLQKITSPKKSLVEKKDIMQTLKGIKGVVLTIGAGDIDRLVEPIKMELIQA